MRAVSLFDLDMAARALMAVPDGNDRHVLMQDMLDEAHLADRIRKGTGRSGLSGTVGRWRTWPGGANMFQGKMAARRTTLRRWRW